MLSPEKSSLRPPATPIGSALLRAVEDRAVRTTRASEVGRFVAGVRAA